jgi:hypothetical protein
MVDPTSETLHILNILQRMYDVQYNYNIMNQQLSSVFRNYSQFYANSIVVYSASIFRTFVVIIVTDISYCVYLQYWWHQTQNFLSTKLVCYEEGWYSSNVLILYLGGAWFRSWLEHWLPWLRYLQFSSVCPVKCWDSIWGHNHLLHNPFQFIIHWSSYCLILHNLIYW